MEEQKLYLVAVGKLLDRDYQFLTQEAIEEINKGLHYEKLQDAFTDEECEKNAVIITTVPVKGRMVEIFFTKKHKALEHMELSIPIYVATTVNKTTGEVSRMLMDVETLPTLNNDKEELTNTTMLKLPEGMAVFSAQILYNYIIAKCTIDLENGIVKLDDNITAEIGENDSLYSLAQKILNKL